MSLSRIGLRAKIAQKTPCKTLFYGLHHDRWIATLGFAEEQMHMLRHDYVTHDHKMIAAPYLLQHYEKKVAIFPAAKQRAALVTTGGDKVQISSAVAAMEPVGRSE